MANLGNLIGDLGAAIGAPELHISEFFGSTPENTQRNLIATGQVGNPYNSSYTGTDSGYQSSGNSTLNNPVYLNTQTYQQKGGPAGSGGSSNNYDSNSFGNPNNPDLSNPVKKTDYENYLRELQNSAAYQEQKLRGEINSGYNNYFSQLDSILNEGLPQQRQAQENIAQSQYNQGINTLSGQRDSSLTDLGRETEKTQGRQISTLNDISSNISNLFNSGANYLGSFGVGSPSAANQYSYALTKLGSQQRGDALSQFNDIYADIGAREEKVKSVYDTESRNLQETMNQQINSISSWFAEQQNALKQAKAQGQLSRGQDLASLSKDLLNNAMQQIQNIQSQAQNRQSALEQWAISNSQNISQLRNNLGQVSGAPFAQAPTAQPIDASFRSGSQGLSSIAPTGFGSSSRDRDIFGNPIR